MAMRFETAARVEAPAWDADVISLAGNVFHTTTWAAYVLARQPRLRAVYSRLLSDANEPLGLCLGFVERSHYPVLSSPTATLSASTLPAVGDGGEDRQAEFLAHLKRALHREHIVSLEFGSFVYRGGKAALEHCGFATRPRFEFEVDLTLDEDTLWKAMKKSRREDCKFALRQGVEIVDLDVDEGLAALHELQKFTRERVRARGGTYGDGSSDPEKNPARLLVESEIGHLVGCRVGKQIVSVNVLTEFNGVVYHTLMGHNRLALESKAPPLFVWEMIKRFRARGNHWFNMGGCGFDATSKDSPEHGVYNYKRHFGGRTVECYGGRLILRPQSAHAAQLLRRLLGRAA